MLHYLTTVGNVLSQEEADSLLKGAKDDIDLATFKGLVEAN